MADLSDVTAALASAIAGLIYPSGATGASAIGVPCQISEGWPLPAALEAISAKPGQTVTSPISIVSIYPVPGSTGDGGTIMDFDGHVVSQDPAGIAAIVDDDGVTFSGLATGNEIITILVDGSDAFSYVAAVGDTPDVVAAQLAIDIGGGATSAEGGILTVPGTISLAARIGTTAVIGRNIHRQRTQIRVITWSSKSTDRNIVAAAIDVFIKDTIRFAMPDTSSAIVVYQGTNLNDNIERDGLYRRDLIYTATYDTIAVSDAVEVTNVSVQFTLGQVSSP